MKRIYLYLFLFSLIINIFLYVNDTNILKEKDQHIEHLEKKLKKVEDSLQNFQRMKQMQTENDTIIGRI